MQRIIKMKIRKTLSMYYQWLQYNLQFIIATRYDADNISTFEFITDINSLERKSSKIHYKYQDSS